MNHSFLLVAVALVAVAWVGVVYVLRHWGAGYPNRSVLCPHKDTRATISTVCYTKSGWGSVVEKDVLQCSLLGGRPVTCDKGCLAQL